MPAPEAELGLAGRCCLNSNKALLLTSSPHQTGYLLLALSSVRCLKFREQVWMSWSKACSVLISSFSSCPSCCRFPGRVGSSNIPLPLGTEQSPSVSLSAHPGAPTPGRLCRPKQEVQNPRMGPLTRSTTAPPGLCRSGALPSSRGAARNWNLRSEGWAREKKQIKPHPTLGGCQCLYPLPLPPQTPCLGSLRVAPGAAGPLCSL